VSVTATFVAVAPSLLTTLRQHPPLARCLDDKWAFIDRADDIDVDGESFWRTQVSGRIRVLELGKGWDSAHQLLRAARRWRTNPAEVFEIGTHVPEDNVTLLSPSEVQRVAHALDSTTTEHLRSRAGRLATDTAPPYPFDRGTPLTEIVEYAMEAIDKLRPWLAAASRDGHGVVRWTE
jgi:hypothetical protein